MYVCVFINNTVHTMAKKRKLNSKNPRYHKVNNDNSPVIDKRVRMKDAAIRNASGNKTGDVCRVYAVFYKD